jgi:hypothetical protein
MFQQFGIRQIELGFLILARICNTYNKMFRRNGKQVFTFSKVLINSGGQDFMDCRLGFGSFLFIKLCTEIQE